MGAGGDSHITVFHHLAVNKIEGEIYIDLDLSTCSLGGGYLCTLGDRRPMYPLTNELILKPSQRCDLD